MKKLIIIAATIILSCMQVNAQQFITVQNGSSVSFYSNLDSAIIRANNGDTLYLPGGSFSINTSIDKRLYIYGVGHNSDSTAATSPTYITGAIYLITGASGGTLTGLFSQGGILFGNNGNGNNANVSNYSISRCNIAQLYFYSNAPSNNVFYENIIHGNLVLGQSSPYSQSNGFYNNIIEVNLYNVGANNSFKNNIFLFQMAIMVELM